MGVSDKPYTKGKLDTMFRNLGIKLGIFTMKSKPSKCFGNCIKLLLEELLMQIRKILNKKDEWEKRENFNSC